MRTTGHGKNVVRLNLPQQGLRETQSRGLAARKSADLPSQRQIVRKSLPLAGRLKSGLWVMQEGGTVSLCWSQVVLQR